MAKPHLFQHATVSRIIKETADTRTYVLAPRETPFHYRAGQFCTFKVHVDGEDLYRSYSMSSAPETDSEMATTVKRVPGGKVSNWMLDNLVEGDEVTLTRAAGTFCLTSSVVPVLGFSGGSGSRRQFSRNGVLGGSGSITLPSRSRVIAYSAPNVREGST